MSIEDMDPSVECRNRYLKSCADELYSHLMREVSHEYMKYEWQRVRIIWDKTVREYRMRVTAAFAPDTDDINRMIYSLILHTVSDESAITSMDLTASFCTACGAYLILRSVVFHLFGVKVKCIIVQTELAKQ